MGLVPFSTKIAKPRGDPTRPPQEATICSTGIRLKLQMTILKLKFAVWKLKKIAISRLKLMIAMLKMTICTLKLVMLKRKIVIWTLHLAIRKRKINILKSKMAKNAKMQVLEAKFSKMTAANFWSNSLYGLSTVFNENRQTTGGPHKTPPRSDNLQHRHPFEAPNDHFEAKICRLEAKNRDFAIKIDDSDAKNDHLHAKIGHFEAKNCHLDAKFGHSQTKNKHFEGQNCQKRQNAGFGGQIFQNDSPQFLAKFFIWA